MTRTAEASPASRSAPRRHAGAGAYLRAVLRGASVPPRWAGRAGRAAGLGAIALRGWVVRPVRALRPGRILHWLTPVRVALAVLILVAVVEGAFIAAQAGLLPRLRLPFLTIPVRAARHATPVPVARATPAVATTGPLTTGQLLVQTDPPGGIVFVDHQRLGPAPMQIADLAPGEHRVVVANARREVVQQVQVTAGQVVDLVVPLGGATATAPASAETEVPPRAGGWLAVTSPVELRIFQDDQLIGTSAMKRVPLAPGAHNLVLQNDAVGVNETRAVRIAAGQTASVTIDMPKQTVAINALPWAEVWVDGTRLGETPIGNAKLAVGPHVIVLKNPDLGERSIETTVTALEPARISVDLRK